MLHLKNLHDLKKEKKYKKKMEKKFIFKTSF